MILAVLLVTTQALLLGHVLGILVTIWRTSDLITRTAARRVLVREEARVLKLVPIEKTGSDE